jgi:hypothetical protein
LEELFSVQAISEHVQLLRILKEDEEGGRTKAGWWVKVPALTSEMRRLSWEVNSVCKCSGTNSKSCRGLRIRAIINLFFKSTWTPGLPGSCCYNKSHSSLSGLKQASTIPGCDSSGS